MTGPPDVSQAGHILDEARLAGVDREFLAGMHRWVVRPLTGCTTGAIREVGIVLGELLANAFRHAEPPFAVRLTVPSRGFAIRLEVEDGTVPPERAWPVGKGLLVVRGLCPDWGVRHRAGGKTVWAELPVLVPPTGA